MPANNRIANILVSDEDVANLFVAFLTDESDVGTGSEGQLS